MARATRSPRGTSRRPSAGDPFTWQDLRFLLDRAADVVFRYALVPRPGYEYVSRASIQVTGYTPDEHYADPKLILKLVHPDDRPLMQDVLDRGASGVPIILRWLRKDGRIVWVEQRDTSVFNPAGKLIAIEGIAREIADPASGSRPSIRVLDDVRIDLDRGRVLVDGHPVRLTPSEFRLLVLLTDQPGRTVRRETIMEALWDSQHIGSGRTCEVHISKLRAKIERNPKHPVRIETVRGQGYRFAPA